MVLSDERRRADRHVTQLEAEIDVGGGPSRSAITRDASEAGVLLLTDQELGVGQEVALRCRIDHTMVSAVGTVVRTQTEEQPPWRFSVAIRLSAKNPLVAEIFRQLAIRQSQPPPAEPGD